MCQGHREWKSKRKWTRDPQLHLRLVAPIARDSLSCAETTLLSSSVEGDSIERATCFVREHSIVSIQWEGTSRADTGNLVDSRALKWCHSMRYTVFNCRMDHSNIIQVIVRMNTSLGESKRYCCLCETTPTHWRRKWKIERRETGASSLHRSLLSH